MKKLFFIGLSAAIAFGFSTSALDTVDAKTTKVVKYANCKALNKVYSGGVAKSSTVKNKGGKTKYKPFVSKAIYNANISKDRDKDGIACER